MIGVVGHWPNKVPTTGVEGKIGESGISHNILDIGTDQVTNFGALWALMEVQYHTQVHNYCSTPFDRIIRLLFLHIQHEPLILNLSIVLKHYEVFTSYIELSWREFCTMQVYHLKSTCQDETTNQPKWLEIGLGGNWPKQSM